MFNNELTINNKIPPVPTVDNPMEIEEVVQNTQTSVYMFDDVAIFAAKYEILLQYTYIH